MSGRYWRYEISQRYGILISKGVRMNDKNSLFVRENGCPRCPYYASDGCPHGIGIIRYERNLNRNGVCIHKMGDIKTMHDNGICNERVAELHEYMQMTTNLNGLKQKRSHSLWEMENTLSRIKSKLNSIIQKDDDVIIRDLETGDIKLVTLINQIDTMHHRYHEKLDSAIKQESKVEQAKDQRRLKADDINEALKMAKQVDWLLTEDLGNDYDPYQDKDYYKRDVNSPGFKYRKSDARQKGSKPEYQFIPNDSKETRERMKVEQEQQQQKKESELEDESKEAQYQQNSTGETD